MRPRSDEAADNNVATTQSTTHCVNDGDHTSKRGRSTATHTCASCPSSASPSAHAGTSATPTTAPHGPDPNTADATAQPAARPPTQRDQGGGGPQCPFQDR